MTNLNRVYLTPDFQWNMLSKNPSDLFHFSSFFIGLSLLMRRNALCKAHAWTAVKTSLDALLLSKTLSQIHCRTRCPRFWAPVKGLSQNCVSKGYLNKNRIIGPLKINGKESVVRTKKPGKSERFSSASLAAEPSFSDWSKSCDTEGKILVARFLIILPTLSRSLVASLQSSIF